MNAKRRGRPFEPGQSGNPGGRPKALGELRDLARTHAAEAINELARLAVKARSESVRVAAIRELLDRGYGRATQFLAADNDTIPTDKTADELRTELLTDFALLFPDYRLVPNKRPVLIEQQADRVRRTT